MNDFHIFDFDGTLIEENSTRELIKILSLMSIKIFFKFSILLVREKLFNKKSNYIDHLRVLNGCSINTFNKALVLLENKITFRYDLIKNLGNNNYIVSYGIESVIYELIPQNLKLKFNGIVANQTYLINNKLYISSSIFNKGKYLSSDLWKDKDFTYYTDDVVADIDIVNKAKNVVSV